MKRLEALADSIASLNDYWNPESPSYGLRNPGLLRAKTLEHLGNANDDCYRIFSCHQAGYKSLIDTLRKQCERYGRSTVADTLAYYGHGNEFAVAGAVDFIQRSLDDRSVGALTELSFFLEYMNV
jgi:hypothetical protein